MEGTREVVRYSVIRYISNSIRGEILNVGVIMNTPSKGEFCYKILSPNNTKIKALFENKIEKKVFETGINYFEYLLKSINNNDLTKSVDIFSSSFIDSIHKNIDIPKQIMINSSSYAKTASPDLFFNDLLEMYLGKSFILEEKNTRVMKVRKKATELINERNLINVKVKKNVIIQPIANIAMNYQVDFGYSENNSLKLIHSAPEKISSVGEWFEKINLISTKFEKAEGINLLFNSNAESNRDNALSQMIDYLSAQDSRIQSMDIFSTSGVDAFENELDRIEEKASNLETNPNLWKSLVSA